MKILHPVAALVALGLPASAHAQDAAAPPHLAVTGAATLATDYRLRGVSQSDRHPAVQGGITLSHDSGVYAGVWASSLAGWGTFGGANMELDLIGGYRAKLGDGATLDAGLTWYMYPGGAAKTDYAEPFAKLTGTAGPATLTAAVAYAPKQQALGKWYATGADAVAGTYTSPGAKGDNLYLWGDGALALTGTPVTAKAHIGHSHGQNGLGPNATAVSPTGDYWDWSLGADVVWRNLTLNLSYVDTDISTRDARYLQPAFSQGQDGRGSIAGATLVASVSASF
ncbi:TorF family putative porin [uncultured Sphingomonas sp.]|uniref:TorF family putative porin n=1 Tax=uncultured Sphingomonas sp. TaxID=158754 RepID=UPI0025F4EDA9|nr:TorF family putative porin [uncultured Sphingomonas sp.]